MPTNNPNGAVNTAAQEAQKLVTFGASLIKLHIPYVWGGTTTKGFDCSGFTQYAYKHALGINIPRTSEEQAHVGVSVPRSALQPGDLLFYDIDHANSHVAMYAGGGQQIVARHTGTFLQFQSVGNFSHAQRIIGNIPGGTVGGVSQTPANNAVDISGGLSDLIPTPQSVGKAIADSLGIPDIKDGIQRLGLILFGGGLVLYGIYLLNTGVEKKVNEYITGGNDKDEKESSEEEKGEAPTPRTAARKGEAEASGKVVKKPVTSELGTEEALESAANA